MRPQTLVQGIRCIKGSGIRDIRSIRGIRVLGVLRGIRGIKGIRCRRGSGIRGIGV